MSNVNVGWRKDQPKKSEMTAKDFEKYLLKDRGTEMLVTTINCTQGQAIDEFIQTQRYFGKYSFRDGKPSNIAFINNTSTANIIPINKRGHIAPK